jgi:hypothetical protein
MGFSIGGVLASYVLGAFHLPKSNRSIASLNCPWIAAAVESVNFIGDKQKASITGAAAKNLDG